MFKPKSQILVAALMIFSAVSIAIADAPMNIAVKALSQKLKTDLAVSDVNLKLNKIERQSISRSEVRIKGNGAANDLPINFDIKVNVAKQMPMNVDYVFVEAVSSIAVADTGDVLTRDLLNKLNKDFKTENIVVSIDSYDTAQAGGKKRFTGTGDVRLGFDWNKISFNVTVDAKTNQVMNVEYEVKQ